MSTDPVEELRAALKREQPILSTYTELLCDYLATVVPIWSVPTDGIEAGCAPGLPPPGTVVWTGFTRPDPESLAASQPPQKGGPSCAGPGEAQKPASDTEDRQGATDTHQGTATRSLAGPPANVTIEELAKRDRQLVEVLRERDSAILVRNMALAALRSIKATLDRELPELEGMLKR